MYEVIQQLCKQRGTNIKALESSLGFSSASIRKWDTSPPSIAKVLKVAKFFEVDINYLIGEETKKAENEELSRTEVVTKIVTLFNTLEDTDKELTLSILNAIH